MNVAAAEIAPKGLFPFYAPGHDSFLSVFPLSHDVITPPVDSKAAASLQAEPEVGIACEVRYAADGTVEALVPFAFGACNDCSIRVPGAAKISEKKNWGTCSKGVAPSCCSSRSAPRATRHSASRPTCGPATSRSSRSTTPT